MQSLRGTQTSGQLFERLYLKNLRRLSEATTNVELAMEIFVNETPEAVSNYSSNAADTNARETQRRHLQELRLIALEGVQALEKRLGVRVRWTPSSKEWQETETLVDNLELQQATDHLQGLVVSRLFELKGMNKAGQGYKLRQHVGKALKSRSQAIQTAVDRYNKIAGRKNLPTLDFQTVIEYTFLAEFDLLWQGRRDIRAEPWTKPAARMLMDQYYKIERAREERQRLDVEIRRLATWMEDEEAYLAAKEEQEQDEVLSYHIGLYRERRTRYNPRHFAKLSKLLKQAGCTADLTPGEGALSSWRRYANTSIRRNVEAEEEEGAEEEIQKEADIEETHDHLVLIEGVAAKA
ncbi:hypothetical protein V5O48_017755 [Marasmius crinis-equi]|uniref:Uncharacterized protein n=1 Tax=Marasmius crinis-equi TaxID=585013 RepID=A0ABR3EN27_9AGAR